MVVMYYWWTGDGSVSDGRLGRLPSSMVRLLATPPLFGEQRARHVDVVREREGEIDKNTEKIRDQSQNQLSSL
jgi:hypothetical protein